MDAERWARLRRLLHEARRVPAGERPAFARRASQGDAELEEELRSLIAADAAAQGWLERPLRMPEMCAAGAESASPQRVGNYLLLERLGEGGMGVVYRARDETLGRDVALKMIRADQVNRAQVHGRFKREVQIVARLQHPGIVPIYAVGEAGGAPYFAMELVRGCSVQKALDVLAGSDPAQLSGADLSRTVERLGGGEVAGTPADAYLFAGSWEETCVRIVRQLADALSHVHARDVLHRDITPSNVMLTASGRALLLDFGIASAADSETLTGSDVQIGSLYYLSPEQSRRGAAASSPRSDVYALGAVLYKLLTLREPFRGRSFSATHLLIQAGAPPAPSALNRAVSWETETVCLTALDVEPSRRYATAADFARDLGNALDRRPIEARRASLLRRTRRWIARNPTLAVGTAVGGAFASVILFGGPPLVVYAKQQAERADLVSGIQARDDLALLSGLLGEVDTLPWPGSEPDQIERISGWLGQANDLAGRIPRHREALLKLEGESAPAGSDASSSIEREEDVARLEGLLSAAILGVNQRLAIGKSLRRTSIDDQRAAWDAAIASLRDECQSPAFKGLGITPQVGLVPLGRNPKTGWWEFWHVLSGDRPVPNLLGGYALDDEAGMVLVLLPGGVFTMGAQAGDPAAANYFKGAESKESPPHAVTLAPFFVSAYEMTQAQWQRCTGTNPSYYSPDSGWGEGERTDPVEQVSYNDCLVVLGQLGLKLPTEAQWEYAARGGTCTPWSTGSEPLSLLGYANIGDEGSYVRHGVDYLYEPGFYDGCVVHCPVGTYSANPFGLYDMHGNVAEWVADCLVMYDVSPRSGDGLREVPKNNVRGYRGGHAEWPAVFARSSDRRFSAPGNLMSTLGVRAARPLDLEGAQGASPDPTKR